jgi:CRP/FNR family transcriptional regulator
MGVTGSGAVQESSPKGVHQSDQAFDGLKGEASARFKVMGVEKTYSDSATIFAEGDAAEHVYILRTGRMKLSVTSREGKTMILRIAGAGQVLGLAAALTTSEHEVSAEALEPCRVTAIRTRDFLNFIEKYPEASMEATRCVLQEYQLVFSDICRLALPTTVAGRLANLLLDWLKRCSQPGQPTPRFTMALTHEEIAGMACTSRETVSRVLQQFQRDKVISVKGASITVLRPEALEQLAM